MKTSNFTLDEAVTICAMFTAASDGEIHDDEITLLVHHPFFKKHNLGDHSSLFSELLKAGKLADAMNELSSVLVPTDSEFKGNFIQALVSVITADGAVEEGEVVLLTKVGSLLGLSSDELDALIGS